MVAKKKKYSPPTKLNIGGIEFKISDGAQRTPKPAKMSLNSGPKTTKKQESAKKLKCLQTSIFTMF